MDYQAFEHVKQFEDNRLGFKLAYRLRRLEDNHARSEMNSIQKNKKMTTKQRIERHFAVSFANGNITRSKCSATLLDAVNYAICGKHR